MKSCNRGIVSVLLCVGLSQGCSADGPDLATTTAATLSVDGTVVLPATGWGDPGVTTSPVPAGWPTGSVAWCCTNWWIPVPAQPGDVVGSIAALVQDVAPSPLYIPGSQGDGGSSVTLSLVAQVGSTTTTLGSLSSNGSGAQQSRILTLSTPYTVPPGASLLVEATAIAIWPSIVMHPSVIGPVTFAAPRTSAGIPFVRPLSSLTVVPEWPEQGVGAVRVANTWTFTSQRWMYFPVPTNPGEILDGYQIYVNKNSNGSFAVLSNLIKVDSATGQQTTLAGATTSDNAPGRMIVNVQGVSAVAAQNATYLIRIAGNSTSDSFTDAALLFN